jgi:hypothetical protein
MAIFHLEQTQHKRSAGHSAVGGCAYRVGENLIDANNVVHEYSAKDEVVFSEVVSPSRPDVSGTDALPLFLALEAFEKRKDATLGMEYECALPNELTREQNISLVRDYITQSEKLYPGAVWHYGYHDKPDNAHAHIWRSDRAYAPGEHPEGDWSEKEKSWTQKKAVHASRKLWADVTNRHLEKAGLDVRIDHRSLKDQGIDREPQIHVGRGYRNEERRAINDEIIATNAQNESLEEEKKRQLAKVAQAERDERYISTLISDRESEIATLEREIVTAEKEIAAPAPAPAPSPAFAQVQSTKKNHAPPVNIEKKNPDNGLVAGLKSGRQREAEAAAKKKNHAPAVDVESKTKTRASSDEVKAAQTALEEKHSHDYGYGYGPR